MKHILFGDTNRIDEATLSAGSWMAGLPLANLQDQVIAYVARSADCLLTSTKVQLQLVQARSIGVVSLLGHNLSVMAKVRIRGATSAANLTASPLYDSGWVSVWPSGMIPQDQLNWEDENFWLGTLSAEDRAAYNTPFSHVFPTSVVAQYWLIEMDDTANVDGYVQVGRVFIGDAWQPAYNFSYGAESGFNDNSTSEASDAGVRYWDARPKTRTHQFQLEWLSETEAYSRVMEMQRRLGKSGELLVIPDPDDTVNMPRRAFVGYMSNLGKIRHIHRNVFSVPMEIEEKL